MAVTKLNLNNALINGDFTYWQRNTSFTSVANDAYTADRWLYKKSGTMVHNILRSTDVPTTAFGIYSLELDVTTAQASIGATDNVAIRQRIEGNILRNIKGKKIALSFWVKAVKTGTYCVAIRNGANTRSYIMEYSVSAASTWEKKTLRFTHNTAGTWAYDNTSGMAVVFTLAAGSSLTTTADTWTNGDYLATANQVNGVDSTLNSFWLSDVCLVQDNEGQTRESDFVLAGRDIFEELQLCQRYYEKGGNTFPGQTTVHNQIFTNTATYTTGCIYPEIFYKQTKRTASVIVNVYDTLGNISNVTRFAAGGGATTPSTSVTPTSNEYKFLLGLNSATGTHAGCQFSWFADAELY